MRVSFPKSSYNFYPRPPRGGRPCSYSRITKGVLFLSTPSARRATVFVSPESSPGRNFYPRPPRGGRHHRPYSQYLQQNISIHALREEGDRWKNQGSRGGFISIHALREEGDLQEQQDALRHQISIHALREEGDVGADEHIGNGDLISIHALREEGDHTSPWNGNPLRNFYPRPPRGGRLCKRPKKKGSCRISIHALREEGDIVATFDGLRVYNFYPRPPRGGRHPRKHRQRQTV